MLPGLLVKEVFDPQARFRTPPEKDQRPGKVDRDKGVRRGRALVTQGSENGTRDATLSKGMTHSQAAMPVPLPEVQPYP